MAGQLNHYAVGGVPRRESRHGQGWSGALALLASSALLAACSAELVPLTPTADGNARAERSGIEVQAKVEPAREYIPRSLTPVKIAVRNLSPQGVYVSLEDIRLVGEGTRLAAVEPIDIEPRRPVPTMGVDPASPFAGSVVSSTVGIPVYKHGFGFDPRSPAPDFQGYRSYREFAKQEIVKDAFDAGFIDSGEARQGYVYFQAPPEGVQRVNLEVRLHSGEGSGPGVVVDIPYATNG
jgi:hypothetical protein